MKAPKKTINVIVNPTKEAIERIASVRFIRGYDDGRIKKQFAKLDGCAILYPETHDALHFRGETREEKTCQEWSKRITSPIDFIPQLHIFNHSIHGFGRNFLSF